MATAAEHSRRYRARRRDDEIVRCIPVGRAGHAQLQENAIITERQKAFRQEYRSRIVG
jgi:hypothetical protein